MRRLLSAVAGLQVEQPATILLAALIVTVILGAGVPAIELETDFQDSLPEDLPPIVAQDRVEAAFQSSDSILILFENADEPRTAQAVNDHREPRVIAMHQDLADRLEDELIVASVSSPADLFDRVPEEKSTIRDAVSRRGSQFFSRDYTASQMFVELSEDMTEDNIVEARSVIENAVADAAIEPGVTSTITGQPVIRTDIGTIMVQDSALTIGLSSLVILLLLIVTRGRIYGPITFVPLFLGLIWTLGIMGMTGIPLTIATVALGAMILGLGVEYGSFITERIHEEHQASGSIDTAVRRAVPTTGLAILGSSSTTIVGFSALLIASISFIRNLGLTLALGIFLTLVSALVVTPALIVVVERWST